MAQFVTKRFYEMLEQSVDRMLAELWAISDSVIASIRHDANEKHQAVAKWEPAPMPSDYQSAQDDFL